MAVAAYASLLSLTHVLDNLQLPARRHLLHLQAILIQSLQEKVKFLQGFLELHSQRISQETEHLARQIVAVADEAEHIIDLYVVNQLRERSQNRRPLTAAIPHFRQEIIKLIRKIDSITKKLMVIKEEWDGVQDQQPIVAVEPVGSTTLPSSDKNTMVGSDEVLVRVIDELTRGESDLQILPIVGMGGIGKTTLAQNAFDHPYIVNRFDLRIWFTISQQYKVRDILLKYFLNNEKNKEDDEKEDDGKYKDDDEKKQECITDDEKNEEKGESLDELGVAELGERMHKLLFGERYLIIMDDMWSIKAWEDFMSYLPNNENGSRILVTTRLLDVARPLSIDNHYFTLDLLDEDKSWNLLCEKVFAQESCPYPELEEIGREIAKGCRGLPLSIVVIGALLARSKKTREYWGFVAKNLTSIVNCGEDEYCFKILSLSYNSLSIHLKPCFLYMRVFPEDHEIKASELIKLWISEGFVKPIGGKSLEEVAEEYLEDLTNRNLILIRKRSRRGNINTCSVHDILRDLCLRESNREHLIRLPKVQHIALSGEQEDRLCFLCSQLGRRHGICLHGVAVGLRSTIVRPPLCNACNNMYPNLNRSRWVKVFERVKHQSGETFPQHTKLRYLAFQAPRDPLRAEKFAFPCTISLLWTLQTLHLSVGYSRTDPILLLPSEIWEMPQLRHLNARHFVLRGPLIRHVEGKDSNILENLSTLSLGGFRCTEKDVVERIPNLKKLNASYLRFRMDDSTYYLRDLAHLNKLESLSLERCPRLEQIAFPTSLKKLSLSIGRNFSWEKMTTIGSSLSNLEVLKLYRSFDGYEWVPVEGEFLRLKALVIRDCYLVRWGAEDIHFPNLQSLTLRSMSELEEIPLSIGDIYTLQFIHLDWCSESTINSAKKILEDQEEKGNENLQVYVGGKQVHVAS
ncbi:UNVERIFIED_CONTAM: putative late blight resistance proteinR1A-10 [Sesamum radiatum]|uniref:Late blight resistance proteinR1A-10 n=1 Tax=Sesamum radiatum TaxID=300843 RepID=A0AAW2PK65_SESRA